VSQVTRIIGGSAGGRRLSTPSGEGTRPTSDRVREAIFSAMESEIGPLTGRRFLDLYAGSGAVGLEALSRGAGRVVLVEHDRRAVRVIRANAAALGLTGATVLPGRVERLVAAPPAEGGDAVGFDVAYLDPPYTVSTGAVVGVLGALRAHGWLAAEALVVVERSARTDALHWPEGYEAGRSRKYGETCVWYGRVTDIVTLRPS
jgi:16S rRNA (guanine966-N2)-methyltransferase